MDRCWDLVSMRVQELGLRGGIRSWSGVGLDWGVGLGSGVSVEVGVGGMAV